MNSLNNFTKIKYFAIGTLCIIIVFFGGLLLGKNINVQNPPLASGESFVSDKDLALFWDVWYLLDNKYPFKEKIPSDTDRINGAISGMISSFEDPYISFLPPEQAKLFNQDVKGEFGGVGMEIGIKDGLITVISPLKNSPAEKSGVLSGDIVVEINGISTENMSPDEAVTLIRGDVGTQVSLIVARKGSQSLILVTITREIINLPIIDTKMIDDVFIINLYSFTENSPELFNTALQKFIESGSKKLIIDVRDNPGGFLNAAVDIASQFIYQGKVIAREYAGESLSEIVYRSSGTENIFPSNMKVVLLVNHGSASASEILAGALSEHNVATIVGTQTFGKGSVQELIPLSNGSSLKVTVAKWFTPNNVSLSDKGITPQHIVDISTDSDQDVILNKALQILK